MITNSPHPYMIFPTNVNINSPRVPITGIITIQPLAILNFISSSIRNRVFHRTCCLHPASATHRQMNDEELTACGVYPDLVRYSCGLEDAEDLIADLEQAFAQI